MRVRFIPCPSSARGNNTAFNNATELFCQTILGPRKEWRCVASSCCAYPFEYSASLCVSTITDRLTLLRIHLTKFNSHAFPPEWFHSFDNKLRSWVRATKNWFWRLFETCLHWNLLHNLIITFIIVTCWIWF